MRVLKHISDLLSQPEKEWQLISEKKQGVKALFIGYLMPLLLIPVAAIILGWGLVGETYSGELGFLYTKGWDIGIQNALIYVLRVLATLFLSAVIMGHIMPVFKVEIDFINTLRLLTYAWTPIFLTGIFLINPKWAWVQLPGVIYALVLLHYGAQPMTKVATPARTSFVVATSFVVVTVYAIAHLVFSSVVLSMRLSAAPLPG